MTPVPGPVPGDVFVATDGTRLPCTDRSDGLAWVFDLDARTTRALELGVDDVPALGVWVDGHPVARDPRPGDVVRVVDDVVPWHGVVRRRLWDRVDLDVTRPNRDPYRVTMDMEGWWARAATATYERPEAPDLDDVWAGTWPAWTPPPSDPTDTDSDV